MTASPSAAVRVAGVDAPRLTADLPEGAVVTAGSTGHPGLEPLLVVTASGESRVVANATVEDVRRAADGAADGDLPETATWTVSHDADPSTLPAPDSGPLSVGTRHVLGRCGWADPENAEAYRESGVVADSPPDTVFDSITDAGLLGRGRTDDAADEPISDRWDVAREADGDPVVVVNGNECDPAVAGDELLLNSDPFAVLDGALAVATAVGATDLIVYVGDASATAARRAQRAGEALAGDLTDPPRVQVAAGPETFAAAEATMAIESLSGKERLEARRRPPGPEEWGLYGRPTLVHSPRTFAQVRATLVGASEGLGTRADPGTRLVTVSGTVDAPATVELPTDESLSTALNAVSATGRAKAYRVGGRFGGLSKAVSVPAGANALAGADLGTAGGVEVFGQGDCVLATVGETAALADDGNCGRCVPCREGTTQLANLLREVYSGEFDAGGIRELARVMRSTSLCSFGVDAARPVLTALSAFESEISAHADGRCPAGTCEVGR